MKGFTIAELLIYDPKRPSPKRKPIEIDIQQAKIVCYWPEEVALEQKCNTVGMAEGVFGFCNSLYDSSQQQEGEQPQRGWQTVIMDQCTLILSEVEEDIWIFVKLEHEDQPSYYRLGSTTENSYQDSSFSEQICREFMQHLYRSIYTFYGPIRAWIFRERVDEFQKIVSAMVVKYLQIFKYQNSLDLMSYALRDIRLVPMDVNSTLKFMYFKNVLQSYDPTIAHLIVFAYGHLSFSSLNKENTEYFANYLFATGEPYVFTENRKVRLTQLKQMPQGDLPEKFGSIYNSKVVGLAQTKEQERSSMAVTNKGVDLLGIGSQGTHLQLFETWLIGEDSPLRVNFYYQNSMFFLTFYRQNPEASQLVFQNRFYHDNSDKFIIKINDSLSGMLKFNDPYKFLFHNTATYSGKSTIKDWKGISNQVREILEILRNKQEGVVATLGHQGFWLYGVHRFSRILVILIPSDTPLQKLQDFVSKMTKEYFTKAYI